MSVCPIYRTTSRESDVARGKLAILESIEAGEAGWSERLEEIVSRCLLCGACAQICANSVPTADIIQAGRRRLFEAERREEVQGRLLAGLRFGGLSAKALLRGGRLIQALACRRIPESSGLHLRFPLSFFAQRLTVPPIAWTPFLEAFEPGAQTAGTEGLRIGFFVGCGANYLITRTAWALVRILDNVGAHVVVPKDQVCCGLPAFVSGDVQTARTLARMNIEAFERYDLDAILTVCASCGSHLKRLASLFDNDVSFKDRTFAIARRHHDAVSFLMERLDFDAYLTSLAAHHRPTGVRHIRVAYHDPCHLRIGQGIIEAPRAMLRAIPGVELVEAPHPGRCCGHGGDFNLSHFETSMKILDSRMEDFKKVKPDKIVTGCTGCILQFVEGISRRGLAGRVEVCHPLVLAEKAIAASSDATREKENSHVRQGAQHKKSAQRQGVRSCH